MRKQLLDLTGLLRRQPRQHILEISIRVMPVETRRLDQARDRCRRLAAAQRSRKPAAASWITWTHLDHPSAPSSEGS